MSCREIAVGMVGFSAFLGLYATQPLLPILERTFGASKIAASLTVSAATLGVALAAPWVGVLADLVGRKRIIVPAVWMLGLTHLLAALPGGLGTLVFWRFVQGLLTPAVFAVFVAYVNEEWPPSQTGFVASIYVAGTVLGGFTGRLVTGLIAARVAWNWAFVSLGGFSFLLALLISAWLPKGQSFKRETDLGGALRDMASHLRNRSLLTIYAAE